MRWLALIIVTVLSVDDAAAHDFWLQPREFAAPVDTPVVMTIEVGHGTARQRWAAPLDRVKAFTAVGPEGTRDLRTKLIAPGDKADASVTFARSGTYVVVLETTPALSELPALRFNDYLAAEGITPAIAARVMAKTTDTPGREQYSRRAKTLVKIGESPVAQPQVTRPIGLTLEIVPERDPYASADPVLPVTVYYRGKRLAGALVKLNNLDFDARPVATARTDTSGRASFTIPFKGLWQFNVVWTASVKNPRADFDTVFSSLTFGTRRTP